MCAGGAEGSAPGQNNGSHVLRPLTPLTFGNSKHSWNIRASK